MTLDSSPSQTIEIFSIIQTSFLVLDKEIDAVSFDSHHVNKV